MRLLIVEDEPPAAKRLQQMILRALPEAVILAVIDSVTQAVAWLREQPAPDLIFLDIQLSDNVSFDIFRQISVPSPVIFTTAYDQYALKAFELNSIDYLLKPIEQAQLERALNKYQRFFKTTAPTMDSAAVERLLQSFGQPEYKKRFVIKAGQQLAYINTPDIRYFYSEEGLTYACMGTRKRHAVDFTIDRLVPLLPPTDFFQINRKLICHIQSIQKVSPYFSGRLVANLDPTPDFEVIVSRNRATDFKRWLGG